MNSESSEVVGDAEKARVWATIPRLEILLKLLGAAVGFVLGLGLPAVVFQFRYLGLPLQFITREEAIRAGILPTAMIGLLFGLVYLVRGKQNELQIKAHTDQQRRLLGIATGAVFVNLLMVWGALSSYALWNLHMEYAATLQASLHVNSRVRLVLMTTTIPIFIVGWIGIKWVRRLCRRVTSPNVYQWAKLGLGLSVAVSLIVNRLAMHAFKPGTDTILDVIAAAVFLGSYVILVTLAVDFRSGLSDGERKQNVRQLSFVIGLIYVAAVLFYSLEWYPILPHYIGGGKPIPITIWLEKTMVADPPLFGCAAVNSDFTRCEHFNLISLDGDYYILSLDPTPKSRGVILPRKAVGLISSRQ